MCDGFSRILAALPHLCWISRIDLNRASLALGKKGLELRRNLGSVDRSSSSNQESLAVSSPPHRKAVHKSLGGGAVADVLLWRRRSCGAVLLVAATAMWFLFERAGYSLLSFVANVLLFLVAILFLWAKSASLLNRPLPPLPDLDVSDEFVERAAEALRIWVNRILEIARDITLEGDFNLLLKVIFVLWIISYIGSFFSFLTLVYIGVLLSVSIPALYEKYQDAFDDKLSGAQNIILTQYRKVDSSILRKIPRPLTMKKKAQ